MHGDVPECLSQSRYSSESSKERIIYPWKKEKENEKE
jgi:hypothetical protein